MKLTRCDRCNKDLPHDSSCFKYVINIVKFGYGIIHSGASIKLIDFCEECVDAFLSWKQK